MVFTGCSLWSCWCRVTYPLHCSYLRPSSLLKPMPPIFRNGISKEGKNIAEKVRKGSKKFLVYVYFLLKEWKWSVTLVDVWKETVQHLHHNLESFSHLNNMSFLCFHSLSNHRFRKLCTEMRTEQPNSVVLCLHAGNLLIW